MREGTAVDLDTSMLIPETAPAAGRGVRRRRAHAVWEITLRCNLACAHCGSRAGSSRPAELSTDEALHLVDQLAEIGINEVTLLGGEAFLRPDWLSIARAVVEAGMKCSMTTGGWGVTEGMAARIKDAGISVVGISVDGLEPTHDALRGRKGSWQRCFTTMDRLARAGVRIGCNTQINRLSAPELPRLYEHLREAGIFAWQVQLTGPMGHAADRPEILIQPSELLDVFPLLARVARRCRRDGISLQPGQNVGYYGPYERLLRSGGDPWGFWTGPVEGIAVIGIESDGSVKADPTLPSADYVGGNVRDRPLREIVEESDRLRFNLGAGTESGTSHLWGFCQSCEYAELCRGGDTFTAHVFFGRRGNHPYCHHRALVQQDRGVRERLTLEVAASGQPYDHGLFSIVEEPADAPWPAEDALRFTADKVLWPPGWADGEPGADDDVWGGSDDRRLALALVGPPPSVSLLPRWAWADELAQLRAVLAAKAALDRAEAERWSAPGVPAKSDSVPAQAISSTTP
jgi:radical SAM protein with 4Fe4S-binding SPASM domain